MVSAVLGFDSPGLYYLLIHLITLFRHLTTKLCKLGCPKKNIP